MASLRLQKIISGGQTGADRGGLEAAIALDLDHGGTCPKGRLAEDGRIPDRYKLTEDTSEFYQPRTRKNVRDADATIIFHANPDRPSKGTNLTLECAEKAHRPRLVVNGAPAAPARGAHIRIAKWLIEENPAVLNVAGNRESSVPGMQKHVENTLTAAIRLAQVSTLEELEPHLAAIDGPGKGPPPKGQMRLL